VRAAGGKPKPTPGSDSDGDASARKVPESASDSEATPPPPAGRANSKSKSKSKSKSQGKGKGKGNGNGRGKSQRAPAREQPQPRRPVKRRRGGGGFGGGGGGGGAPAAGPTPTPEEVLEAVRTALATPAELAATAPTLESLGISGVVEVRERQGHDVVDSIEYIIANAALQILAGKGFTFSVPNRGASNQLYVPELDRIVLRDRRSVRPFVSTSTVRKTTIMTRVMQLIHQILLRRIHVTKRDLFYTDVKLFKDQRESDGVLDDISCMVGCTRTSLNVVASEKGIVIGRVTFRDDGDLIDCARMGVGGKAIPPFVDRITDIQSDAEFILLVEKDAAFMRLAEDRFYNKYRCIIITAKGQPDVATRLFLKRLKAQLNIPVFGLVDSDPYGACGRRSAAQVRFALFCAGGVATTTSRSGGGVAVVVVVVVVVSAYTLTHVPRRNASRNRVEDFVGVHERLKGHVV